MSKTRALNIVANVSSVPICRDIALLHEEYMRVLSSVKKGAKCSSCDTAGPEFDEIRNRSFSTIMRLNDHDFKRLKAFLQEDTLSFYEGEAPNIKRVTR